MHNGMTYRKMLSLMGWSQKLSLAGLLFLLMTAASLGNISKSFNERNRGSCLVSMIASLLGALGGIWSAHHFGLSELIPATQAGISPLVWAVIGSVVLSVSVHVIARGRQFLLKYFQRVLLTESALIRTKPENLPLSKS
jgi:uncharacterized membrane protein YeaQ/YmgE (transglycosylase-associated protein family)